MTMSEDQPVAPAAEVAPPPEASRKPRKAGIGGKPKAKAKATKVKAKANGKPATKAKATAKPAKGKAKAKKPRQRDPSKLDVFGYRKGSIRSKAAAIYARKRGATLAEVKDLLGSVQFNILNEVVERGTGKRRNTEETNRNGRKVKRYFLEAAA